VGLDIRYYTKLKDIGNAPADGGYGDGQIVFYDNEYFPGRIAPWKDTILYSYDCSEDREERHFRCGYTSYSVMRNKLAKLAGYTATESKEPMATFLYSNGVYASECGPLFELLNFSDCEGTIGADACKKMVPEFEELWPQIEAEHVDGPFDHFRTFCEYLRRALKAGADKGAIRFS